MSVPRLFLTAFGLGLMRPASGTWGSLPPPALAFVLVTLGVPGWQVHVSVALLGLLFAIACVKFGEWAEAEWGKKDPGEVVADEVAGQAIVLLLLPWREPTEWLYNGVLCAIAFVLFRIFDIIKPPPAHQFQRLPHGWGILVDDLIAGVYAAIVMQAVARLALPQIWT